MTVLAKKKLIERMGKDQKRGADYRLVVTPLLSIRQVGDSSVDVRLGTEFLVPIRTETAAHHYDSDAAPDRAFKWTRREFESPLFLHPQQLVLGATLEYVRMPPDLMAYVVGRSSLGRTGLVIATAVAVAPGYHGCITLEIVNIGEVPIPLYPGMRIAQLVVHECIGEGEYSGRFACSTGPLPPLLGRDDEMKVWAKR